ncbi:MAG: polysaccharide biosynthesis/export family protein [Pseudomonadota bacterium]
MKSKIQQLTIMVFIFLLCSLVWAENQNKYKLGVGDRIEIKVFGEADLFLETTIDDDGIIIYPFIGAIKVIDMTLSKLEQHITRFLKDGYLVNPNVNVAIREYRKFYIRGEVTQPGSYPYHPGLTVDKAVSIAGGFTERAARNKIYIIPENSNKNKPLKIKHHNTIKPGDILIIEQSFF